MGVDIPLRMPLWRLLTADEIVDLGNNMAHEAALGEQVESVGSALGGDDHGELITNTFGTYFSQ